jgi:hypothetical protein
MGVVRPVQQPRVTGPVGSPESWRQSQGLNPALPEPLKISPQQRVPLESVLAKAGAAGEPPLDPALRDYILLITILVAFLEAAAQRLSPQPPAVVMGFGEIQSPCPGGDVQPLTAAANNQRLLD